MVTITEIGDAPDDPPSGYVISPGDVFSGTLFEPSDDDVIAFSITNTGNDYNFSLIPTGASLDYAVGSILNPDPGPDYINSRTTFSGERLEITWVSNEARPTGEQYFRISSYENRSSGSYQVLLVEETGSNRFTNGQIAQGGSTSAAMDYEGDRDWFALDMVPDRSNTFVVTPNGDRGDAGHFGPALIADNLVRSGVNGFDDGVALVTRFDPDEDLDWYLSLYGYQDGVSNDYSVQHIVEALPDYKSHLQMEAGTPFEGQLDFRGDKDGINVMLIPGQPYEFLVEGDGIDPATDLVLDEFTLGGGFMIDRGTEFDERLNHFTGRVLRAGDEPTTLIVNSSDPLSTGGFVITITALGVELTGRNGDDELEGGPAGDTLSGFGGNNILRGLGGNDTLNGGDGNDTLNGGDGDDMISGGLTDADLRDVVYGGEGNDSVDAGYGNDLVFGQGGNDTIAGGFGVDELQGQDGDDVITGSAFSDLVFGGAGNDFVNGGFGHDRINAGSGADKIFHVGGTEDQMLGHGSDWVQDYNSAEGDVLLFGDATATRSQFQVNHAHTQNSEGERSGDDTIEEAFVIHRPTGQILWALVDGDGQAQINLQIDTDVFDLLA